MQQACARAAGGRGLAQYEVSAYARAGAQCRHNLNYWSFGDYLGIGAGAHGKVHRWRGRRDDHRPHRAPREPRRYLAAVSGRRARPRRERCRIADLPFEYLMNALRLTEGFDEREFETRTGLAIRAAVARDALRADVASRTARAHASGAGAPAPGASIC